jgi:hypothetical protein
MKTIESENRRGKSLGLFIRSSLFGTLMRAGLFITAIPISASAQTREQIAATQAQIAARQAQNNADPAISQRDALQARLDAISQGDALEVQLEDETLAVRDSLQNQAKIGEAAAAPGASAALAARDLTVPPAAAPSPTPSPAETPVETTPVPDGGTDATPRAAVLPAPPAAFTPAAPRPKARGRHGYQPQPPARPQPQPTFWQRLFGQKETKKTKPGKPRS